MDSRKIIDSLIQLVSATLKPLAIVDIDSERFEYHVPVKHAEESRVVLVPKFEDERQRAFVFIVSHHQSIWKDDSQSSHWSIAIDWQDSKYTHYIHKIESYYEDSDHDVVVMNVDPEFYTCAWSSCHDNLHVYNFEARSHVTAEQVANFILNTLIGNLLKNVDSGPITTQNLIHHWAPSYAFPTCEEYFWSHFKDSDIKKYVSKAVHT